MPGSLEPLLGEEKQYFVQLGDGKAYGPVVEKSLRRLAAGAS